MQALILCGRYADAREAGTRLCDGADRLYLEAEACWRQGDLERAQDCLVQALQHAANSTKCLQLHSFVEQMQVHWHAAQAAAEDGEHADCGACGLNSSA